MLKAIYELCRLYCSQFYYATIFTPTRAYFRSLYATTRKTSWFLKLVIYSPVQSWFRNSEVLCKLASHTVHCHAAGAAISKNLQWKAEKGAEVNRAEWEFTNGTAIFRSFRLEREKMNTFEDFHLFRKRSGEMSCTIWISNRNFRFLLSNGKRPSMTQLLRSSLFESVNRTRATLVGGKCSHRYANSSPLPHEKAYSS